MALCIFASELVFLSISSASRSSSSISLHLSFGLQSSKVEYIAIKTLPVWKTSEQKENL